MLYDRQVLCCGRWVVCGSLAGGLCLVSGGSVLRTKKSLQRHQKQGCPRRGEKTDKPPRRKTKKQLALELAETEPTGFASDDDVSTFGAAAAAPSQQQPPSYTPPYIVPAQSQTSAGEFPPYVFQL